MTRQASLSPSIFQYEINKEMSGQTSLSFSFYCSRPLSVSLLFSYEINMIRQASLILFLLFQEESYPEMTRQASMLLFCLLWYGSNKDMTMQASLSTCCFFDDEINEEMIRQASLSLFLIWWEINEDMTRQASMPLLFLLAWKQWWNDQASLLVTFLV